MKILVVDDEPQFARALVTNLRGAGYEVESAATAQEALAAAGLRPPDAVILDLRLPDGSGRDVVRELRRWSETPVIVVSAIGDEDEKIAALDAGADDYVTKPFAIGELLARCAPRCAAQDRRRARARGRADPRRLDAHAVTVDGRPAT
jgi:two-component system KDP operon response regulator KdpE